MRLTPSTTLSAVNGARALWKWIRRPSANEGGGTPFQVQAEGERQRLRAYLDHHRAMNELHAEAREKRMESAMDLFATVQRNKQKRSLHSAPSEDGGETGSVSAEAITKHAVHLQAQRARCGTD